MNKYYVRYSGWGQWGKFDKDGVFNLYGKQKRFQGVFQLLDKDDAEIKRRSVVEIGYLETCDHKHSISPPYTDMILMTQTCEKNNSWEWDSVLLKTNICNKKNKNILLPCPDENY